MGSLVPQTQFLPRTISLGLLPMDRKAIEQQIDYLIDMLDRIDGDADLEPDHEEYDACDLGEMVDYMPMLPKYGVNQTRGPTNRKAAWEQHYASICSETA